MATAATALVVATLVEGEQEAARQGNASRDMFDKRKRRAARLGSVWTTLPSDFIVVVVVGHKQQVPAKRAIGLGSVRAPCCVLQCAVVTRSDNKWTERNTSD